MNDTATSLAPGAVALVLLLAAALTVPASLLLLWLYRRAVLAANARVSQAESIRTFRILATPFTERAGLLTPSLKIKRRAVEQAYAQHIEALYDRRRRTR